MNWDGSYLARITSSSAEPPLAMFETFDGTYEFTVTEPPHPPIGRFPEDSLTWVDARGLTHWCRPVAEGR